MTPRTGCRNGPGRAPWTSPRSTRCSPSAGHATTKPATRDDRLTPREVEILLHVAQGQSNRQIAQQFTLSEKTVRNHVERIYGKLGVSNRIGASLYALENGIMPVSHAH